MKKILSILALGVLYTLTSNSTSPSTQETPITQSSTNLNTATPVTQDSGIPTYKYTITGMQESGIMFGDFIINTVSATYFKKATSGTIIGYTKGNPVSNKGQSEVYNMLEAGLTQSSFNTACGWNALGCCGGTIAYKTSDEGWLWNFTYTPGDLAWDAGKVSYTKYSKIYGTSYATSTDFKNALQSHVNIVLIDDNGDSIDYNPLQMIASNSTAATYYKGTIELYTKAEASMNMVYIGAYINESTDSTTGLTSKKTAYVYGEQVGETVYNDASNTLNYNSNNSENSSFSL